MAFCGNFLKISGWRAFKARLHVKRGGTARVEMSTGSIKIYPFIRASFVRERIKKWHGPQKIEERTKTVYTLFFSRPGTDRARDMKLQRLVRMRSRPYLKRQ